MRRIQCGFKLQNVFTKQQEKLKTGTFVDQSTGFFEKKPSVMSFNGLRIESKTTVTSGAPIVSLTFVAFMREQILNLTRCHIAYRIPQKSASGGGENILQ